MPRRRIQLVVVAALLTGACGGPPSSASTPSSSTPSASSPSAISPFGTRAVRSVKRRTDLPDDCEQRPGEPPPEPLRIPYDGVAKAARCQREVYTIMGGVTHFLGVACKHCHLEPDYAADTHNKRVANWMARELVPRLKQRSAGPGGQADVWCQDCHAGKPKLLGDPRRRDIAIEWMTTHLTESFETSLGKPPKCRDCHGGDLGSAAFRPRVILEELSVPSPPPPSVSDSSHADAER